MKVKAVFCTISFAEKLSDIKSSNQTSQFKFNFFVSLFCHEDWKKAAFLFDFLEASTGVFFVEL